MSDTQFYTGKGDSGDTGRLGGEERLDKSDLLIDTIGTVDEATCAIGMARALAREPRVQKGLLEVQRRLYRLMSHISATPDLRKRYTGLTEADVAWLEDLIARLSEDAPEVKIFVLPGDSPGGAASHQARAVVRRAERRLVALAAVEPTIGAANLAFMNRLSSLMFVAALQEDRLAVGEITFTTP
ncbi:MAG: cob(I)yrinic acid a,c-diamide adenosyltransferase [Anaerolineae bacterium]